MFGTIYIASHAAFLPGDPYNHLAPPDIPFKGLWEPVERDRIN
jgi:hypothetical protein